MHCEFCEAPLAASEPENVVLLDHIQTNQACGQAFDHLMENLQASWTPNMSGG